MTQHDKMRTYMQGVLRERNEAAPLGNIDPLFSIHLRRSSWCCRSC
jgi:hypothetical protein